MERVHGNTRTYTRSGALSSVPSAPSDVGQCSRLRRSRELVLIKARVLGRVEDDPHSRFECDVFVSRVHGGSPRLNPVVPVTLTRADTTKVRSVEFSPASCGYEDVER